MSTAAIDVLVDSECQSCCFKAAGTYADVEIARRAHRHPNSSLAAIDRAQIGEVWAQYLGSLPPTNSECRCCCVKAAETYAEVEAHRHKNSSLVAIDRAQIEEVWTEYFESPGLQVDTDHLPQPYSRLYILVATLATLIVTAGGALCSRWLVDTWYSPMGGGIHGSFMLLIVGGLVYTVLTYANDRRAANIRRFRIVAECNHHIRNALQVLTFTCDPRLPQGSDGRRKIADAVHRIELTLAEVFPRVLQRPHTDFESSETGVPGGRGSSQLL